MAHEDTPQPEITQETEPSPENLEQHSSEDTEGRSVEREADRQKILERFSEERSGKLTEFLTSETVSNGLDLTPFTGGGKMIMESIAGRKLTGKEVNGRDRIIHGAIGAGSLALDFTGVGEAGKGAIIAGKSVVLLEKLGARLAAKAPKASRVMARTVQFMKDNPDKVAFAEKYAEERLQQGITIVKHYREQAAA